MDPTFQAAVEQQYRDRQQWRPIGGTSCIKLWLPLLVPGHQLCRFDAGEGVVTAFRQASGMATFFIEGPHAAQAYQCLAGMAGVAQAIRQEPELSCLQLDQLLVHARGHHCACDEDPPMDFLVPGHRRAEVFNAFEIIAYCLHPSVTQAWRADAGPEQLSHDRGAWLAPALSRQIWGRPGF